MSSKVSVAEPGVKEPSTEKSKSVNIQEDDDYGIQLKEIPDDDESEDLDAEEEGRQSYKQRDPNKWHNFESQYSLAIQQSEFEERGQWSNQVEFLMSCIASSVGLGNIWRFPFVAGENGGGAFLIPYFLVILIIARPLFFLELSWGQFCSGGPVTAWEMAPMFKGVAYSQTIVSFLTASFYMVIMCWTLLYFGYSFFDPLPWVAEGPGKFFGVNHLKEDKTQFKAGEGLGCPPDWKLIVSLFVSWFLVWCVMVRGVSGAGKVAYFTALFPYFVLLILLIRGSLLDGAGDGVLYFLYPQVEKLLMGQTWFQAVSQCFFSLGISFGGLVMFSSYNKFKHPLGRDVLIISIMDTFTSFLAGITIFGILGNLAYVETEAANKEDFKYNSTVTAIANVIGEYNLTSGSIHFNTTLTRVTLWGRGQLNSTVQSDKMFSLTTGTKVVLVEIGSWIFNGSANVTGPLKLFQGFATINGNPFKNNKTGKLNVKLNGTDLHNENITNRLGSLAKGGAGLAFVAYPQALRQFGSTPLPQIFSVLFFFMIIVLAVGSANGLVGNVVTVLCDSHPKIKRWKILTCVCFMGFFGGIIYTTPAGGEIIDLVDKQGSEFCLFILAFVEIVGISWVYGLRNMVNDIEFMLDQKLNAYWPICWGILIPFLLIGIFGFYLYQLKINPEWPLIATVFGWLLSVAVIGVVPGAAIYVVITRKSRYFKKQFLASIHPTRKWGPKDEVVREAWRRNRLQIPDEYGITTKVKAAVRRCCGLPPVPPREPYVDIYADEPHIVPSHTGESVVLGVESTENTEQFGGQSGENLGDPEEGGDQQPNP